MNRDIHNIIYVSVTLSYECFLKSIYSMLIEITSMLYNFLCKNKKKNQRDEKKVTQYYE